MKWLPSILISLTKKQAYYKTTQSDNSFVKSKKRESIILVVPKEPYMVEKPDLEFEDLELLQRIQP